MALSFALSSPRLWVSLYGRRRCLVVVLGASDAAGRRFGATWLPMWSGFGSSVGLCCASCSAVWDWLFLLIPVVLDTLSSDCGPCAVPRAPLRSAFWVLVVSPRVSSDRSSGSLGSVLGAQWWGGSAFSPLLLSFLSCRFALQRVVRWLYADG